MLIVRTILLNTSYIRPLLLYAVGRRRSTIDTQAEVRGS